MAINKAQDDAVMRIAARLRALGIKHVTFPPRRKPDTARESAQYPFPCL